MLSKETWGPHLWYSIHFIALGFPNEASSIDKKNYKNFYINLPNVIPCEECSKHFANNLNNYQIDNYLESREKLFEWTVIMHNEVNKLLGKEIWSVDKALKHYKNFNIKLEETKKCFNKAYLIIIFLLIVILFILIKKYRFKK
jgi:hypothetical protein